MELFLLSTKIVLGMNSPKFFLPMLCATPYEDNKAASCLLYKGSFDRCTQPEAIACYSTKEALIGVSF